MFSENQIIAVLLWLFVTSASANSENCTQRCAVWVDKHQATCLSHVTLCQEDRQLLYQLFNLVSNNKYVFIQS